MSESLKETMKKFDAFHSEMHHGVVLVKTHIDKYGRLVEDLPERDDIRDRDGHIGILYLRMRAWLISIAKLNHPADLQALACSCRSLLETVVDIALLASDPTNTSGEKMRWWDLSAQYQMAIAYVQFQKEQGAKKKSLDIQAAQDFIQRNQAFVEGLRTNRWPQWKDKNGKPLHPPRWTGNGDLRPDIQTADKSPFHSLIRDNMGKGLLDYYGSEYQKLNRTIHGSGILGVKGSPQLIAMRAAFACWASASLALLCHQIVFKDRDLDKQLPDLQPEWLHLKQVRMSSFIYHIREVEGEDI